MAAEQSSQPKPQRDQFTEPDPAEVNKQIEAYRALSNKQFAQVLADFICAQIGDGVDMVTSYAIRSPALARKARRLIPDLVKDPERFLSVPEGESANAHRARVAAFRARADHESQLLHNVAAALVARRGHLPPESNPRARARRRLADEYPIRFLELVREEEAADRSRAEEAAAERRKQRAASASRVD
ncbi:hypothetical protein ACFWRZ_08535 [Streptomyces rubiginosohelvolus]|uniref:hypothetical protein n=1 Tax=Streptomyces rubiginosohelvolus TaxID=67362 RepID=UPI00366105FD